MTCLSRSVSRSSQIRFVMLTSASTTRSRIILWVRARGSEPSTYRHGAIASSRQHRATDSPRQHADSSRRRERFQRAPPTPCRSRRGDGRSGEVDADLSEVVQLGPAPPRESRRPRGDRGARSRLAPRRRPSRGRPGPRRRRLRTPPPRRRGRSTRDVAQVVGNVFGRGPTRALGVFVDRSEHVHRHVDRRRVPVAAGRAVGEPPFASLNCESG